LLLDWDTGSNAPLLIKTIVEWTFQGFMPDWLSVSKRSGTGNDTLLFQTLKANNTSGRRDAVFYLFSPKAKTATFTVSQKGKSEGIAASEVFSLKIYPNPTSGVIHVKSPFPVEKVRIYNLMGELIKEILQKTTDFMINLSEERRGIYYLSIYSKDSMISRKIVLL
jgi:hypothetical protein